MCGTLEPSPSPLTSLPPLLSESPSPLKPLPFTLPATSPLIPPPPLISPLTSPLWPSPCLWTDPSDVACWLTVAGLVKDVFESPAGQDAVSAVSDYLRTQRVTSLPDLQVCRTHNHWPQCCRRSVVLAFVLFRHKKKRKKMLAKDTKPFSEESL